VVLGALAPGTTSIRGALRSEDTAATLEGIRALGARVREASGRLRIDGGSLAAPADAIDARNSGTTLRFLCSVAATLDGPVVLTGDPSLRRRPLGPLLEALRQLGAKSLCLDADGAAPVRVTGPASPGTARLSGDVSSQFVSSLLLIAPRLGGELRVELTSPLASAPYVEATRDAMRRFGVEVLRENGGFRVGGGQRYAPTDYTVPGDFSSAAFLLAGAAVTGGEVTVGNLSGDGVQADEAVLRHLRAFGAQASRDDPTVTAASGRLLGTEVDLADSPDLFPILAVVAAVSRGRTRLSGAPHLRLKESDRIRTVAAMLRGFGVEARELPDGIEVEGGRLRGCEVDPAGDHRVAMAGAVAGLAADGTTVIREAKSVAVSYPGFFEDLRRLHADVEVIP
jgi:3-phosphoshikimate 1-carboxyvinyltransferase